MLKLKPLVKSSSNSVREVYFYIWLTKFIPSKIKYYSILSIGSKATCTYTNKQPTDLNLMDLLQFADINRIGRFESDSNEKEKGPNNNDQAVTIIEYTTPVETPQEKEQKLIEFRLSIEQAINRLSMEKYSDTPDYILAEYMVESLKSYHKLVERRKAFYSNTYESDNNTLPSHPEKVECKT